MKYTTHLGFIVTTLSTEEITIDRGALRFCNLCFQSASNKCDPAPRVTIVWIFRRHHRLFALTLAVLWPVAPKVCLAANQSNDLAIQFLDDADDGRLDELSLLEAGLIASGVDDAAEIEDYRKRFEELASDLAKQLSDDMQTLAAAERAFGFLHERLLTGEYRAECTEVQAAFESGDYNCVSATLLYHCLCRQHGLDPTPVATNTHVRTRFTDQDMDVETTCNDWFDVVRQDPSALFLRSKLQATRELTDTQLVSKIYYNRGVTLLEEDQFADAVELLEMSLKLDNADQPAKANWCAALNNWALAECDAGQFEHAVELVRKGLDAHADYQPFLANDLHIHQKWAMALCTRRQFEEAAAAFETAHRRRPDVALFDQGRFAIYRQWADALFAARDYASAWRLFARTSKLATEHDAVARLQAEALHRAVDELMKAGNRAKAERLVRNGLRRLPRNPALQQQYRRLTKSAS